MYTVEPALKDHPIGHKNVVCQDRWSLVTGSVILKCGSCQKCVVCQDRWSLVAVAFQDKFHCILGNISSPQLPLPEDLEKGDLNLVTPDCDWLVGRKVDQRFAQEDGEEVWYTGRMYCSCGPLVTTPQHSAGPRR